MNVKTGIYLKTPLMTEANFFLMLHFSQHLHIQQQYNPPQS